MTIIKTRDYQESLKEILTYIASDKKSAAIHFNKELNRKIKDLKKFPFMHRVSIYFDDVYIRDMIFKGYVIPYEVDTQNNVITIIGITKYRAGL